jgi:hypothetical protein
MHSRHYQLYCWAYGVVRNLSWQRAVDCFGITATRCGKLGRGLVELTDIFILAGVSHYPPLTPSPPTPKSQLAARAKLYQLSAALQQNLRGPTVASNAAHWLDQRVANGNNVRRGRPRR